MRYVILFLIFCVLEACVPIQIAPNLDNGKVMEGKKFKRQLPERQVFVFSDPKNSNEFYNYINTIFQLNNNVIDNVPVIIEGESYFLSFYETEKNSSAVNLIPIAFNLASNNISVNTKALSDASVFRKGKWYIALTVSDTDHKDALKETHQNQDQVLAYLYRLQEDYLHTTNYAQLLLQKNTR